MPEKTPRPTEKSPAVLHKAALALIDDLSRNNYDIKHDEADNVAKIIRYHRDGYDVAKAFESEGLLYDDEITADTVSILDSVDVHVRKAWNEEQAKWMAENGIKPCFKIGDEVRTVAGSARDLDSLTGKIVDIDEKTGIYTVCYGALGHVSEGYGTRGRNLPFENVVAATP